MTRVSSIHLVIALVLACGAAQAVGDLNAVPGEKLDSGLGALPHYSRWNRHPGLARYVVMADRMTQGAYRVPGEKLDSGLGNLPRYSQWKGDPELSRFVAHDGTEMVRADAVIGSR